YGDAYVDFYDPSLLGAICSKGITFHSKSGNEGIRIQETPSGLLNSIGLENHGMHGFIQDYLPEMNRIYTVMIINVGGNTLVEYLAYVQLLNAQDIDIIELNISCPNVKEGGMAFGVQTSAAKEITKKVKDISRHKIMVKLSPNAENI